MNATLEELDTTSTESDVGGAIRESVREFKRVGNDTQDNVTVIFTAGAVGPEDVGPHCDFLATGKRNAADLRTAADAAANASVTVHIVGLGTDVNSTLLREVATRTGGTSRSSPRHSRSVLSGSAGWVRATCGSAGAVTATRQRRRTTRN